MNPVGKEDFTFDFQLQRNDPIRTPLSPHVITEDCRGGKVNRIKGDSAHPTRVGTITLESKTYIHFPPRPNPRNLQSTVGSKIQLHWARLTLFSGVFNTIC